MKQTKRINVVTVENDLDRLIKSVENDISNLRLSLADKMALLEKLNSLKQEIKN